MDVADLHDLELIWPSLHPRDVIVTGTFDKWSASIRLAKGDDGFSGTVKVPWGQKVVYKFIVDGRWRCRDDRPQEDDGHGNTNNVFRTPERPQALSPGTHDPPTRLFIPLEGAQDVETMVTAVEFLPQAEPAAVKGSLPLPIPQISVEGLGLTPSADTPASTSKLDTATATEGTVPPASKPSTDLASSEQEPSSSDPSIHPINDNDPASLPPVNGNGEAYDSNVATHAPIRLTKEGDAISAPVPEIAREAVSAPSESTAPQSNPTPPAAQGTLVLADQVDVTPAPTPAAVIESTAKQPEVGHETAGQGHRQQVTAPSSIGRASSASTPASSALTHKKRLSLFAKIKHIFERDNDKREKKEKKH